MERLHFTKSWEDPADYPTFEASEVQVRRDIQSLYTEIQTYINETLVPALEALGNERLEGGAVIIPGDVVRKSGAAMTGPLYLSRDPVEKLEAATKQFVEDRVGLAAENTAGDLAALSLRAGKLEAAAVDQQGSIARLTQRSTGVESLVQSVQGELSEMKQAAGEIRFSVTEQAAADGTVTAKLTLTIGPNSYSGYIPITGNVEVSGQLSAQALYAAGGDVATLTVDSLSTSRRVVKYLTGDTGDDNYIRIRAQRLDFVSGVCAGGRLQAQSPQGQPLYWEDAVYGEAEVGEDGWPRKLGQRIYTTTVETPWPVYVYRYAELVKQSLCFETDRLTGDYAPAAVFGAGDENGANRAYLLKRRSGLDLKYLPPGREEIGIHMGLDGYMDLAGLRKTMRLDFSKFDRGEFTEVLDGGETVVYSVEFDQMDGERVPVKITDGDGHVTAITWKEA